MNQDADAIEVCALLTEQKESLARYDTWDS